MLRITVMIEARRTVLKAEGKLAGPWVKELDHCWQLALKNARQEPIVIDLSDVAFVDRAGKALIGEMCANGAELVVTGPLMTSIVDEMRACAHRI